MGPYCNFCDQRCFVHISAKLHERIRKEGIGRIPDIMATCERGKSFDKDKCGFNIDDEKEDLKMSAKHEIRNKLQVLMTAEGEKRGELIKEINLLLNNLADKNAENHFLVSYICRDEGCRKEAQIYSDDKHEAVQIARNYHRAGMIMSVRDKEGTIVLMAD